MPYFCNSQYSVGSKFTFFAACIESCDNKQGGVGGNGAMVLFYALCNYVTLILFCDVI